jgi:hypothetical protein
MSHRKTGLDGPVSCLMFWALSNRFHKSPAHTHSDKEYMILALDLRRRFASLVSISRDNDFSQLLQSRPSHICHTLARPLHPSNFCMNKLQSTFQNPIA